MQINISFFGASVTEQKHGYVKYFKDLSIKNSNNFTINQQGYGGTHINDAGMCFWMIF